VLVWQILIDHHKVLQTDTMTKVIKKMIARKPLDKAAAKLNIVMNPKFVFQVYHRTKL